MEIKLDPGAGRAQGLALGVDGTRGRDGLAVAEAARARHEDPPEAERPAVIIERSSPEPDPGVYAARPRPASPPALGRDKDDRGTGGELGDRAPSIVEMHIGTLIQLGANGAPPTTILGDGATLEINLHIGTFVRLGDGAGSAGQGGDADTHMDKIIRLVGGGGTTILAPGSVFEVGDRNLGTLVRLGGGGTTILGDGATLKINEHIDTVVDAGAGGNVVLGASQTAQSVAPICSPAPEAAPVAPGPALKTRPREAPPRWHAAPPRARPPEHVDRRWLLLRDIYDATKRENHGHREDVSKPGPAAAAARK